jgi:hypothetical protein
MKGTVHGGPRFAEWQRSKTGPRPARDVRNLHGDLVYTLAPVVVAMADAVVACIETMSPFMEQLAEAGLLDVEQVSP